MIFQKLREFFILQIIHFKVKWVNFIEYLRVLYNYYRNLKFLHLDTALIIAYLFNNPFRISKKFLVSKGAKEIYTYGETPLTTLDLISKQCQLTTEDTVFELGCGRGRTCFWLHTFVGCRVVGVDFVPTFIEIANRISHRYNLERIAFRLEDIFSTDLKGGTVFYLYEICYSDEELAKIVERLTPLPSGTKVITVSYALTDIVPEAPFRIEKKFLGIFTWGKTDVYLQIKHVKKLTERR